MEYGTLRDLWRRQVDDTVEPYLWSDEDALIWFNDAVREACIRARLLQDSDSAACSVAVTEGTAAYALDPSILVVKSARLVGESGALVVVTRDVLDLEYPNWRTEEGTPRYVVFDLDDQKLRLIPTPVADGTLQLTVWREPLEAEQLEGDSDEPAIHPMHHLALLDWVSAKAFSRKDSEAYDPERAAAAEAAFTQRFGPRPTAHALKHMAMNRRRTSRPHYF